jgi:hemerythrin-like domain-containing protein
MIIGSAIKKLIYNKLKEMQIEESKIKEIIQFITDIMDRCWIKMT